MPVSSLIFENDSNFLLPLPLYSCDLWCLDIHTEKENSNTRWEKILEFGISGMRGERMPSGSRPVPLSVSVTCQSHAAINSHDVSETAKPPPQKGETQRKNPRRSASAALLCVCMWRDVRSLCRIAFRVMMDGTLVSSGCSNPLTNILTDGWTDY